MKSAQTRFLAAFCLACLTAAVNGQSLESTIPVVGLKQNATRTDALVGATVVPRPGESIEDCTIVIRRGVITAVGPSVTIPEEARRIDAKGKTIYAGLIDAFSEIKVPAIEAGPRHWNERVMPQRFAADAYSPDKSQNQKLRRQGITVRLIVPSDGLIKGVSALVATGDEGAEQSVVEREVAQHLALTPRGRSRSSGYPSSPMGAVALARQTFYDVQWYRQAWVAWRKSAGSGTGFEQPETNPALASLVDHVDRGLPVIVDASNERYVLRAHRLAEEFDLSVIIRGSGREYRRLTEVAASGIPILLPVNFAKAPDVSTPESALGASLERLMHWDLAPENPALLAKAGISFALTTDQLKEPGKFLPAVRQAVQRGLSDKTALAALTTVPAAVLRVADRLGTIEPGRPAHLVVTDGNLFAEKTKVIETWVGGTRYQHDRFDLPEVRGTWSLVLRTADGTQVAGELKLSGSQGKPKGQLKAADDKYELKNVRWQQNRLSFSVAAKLLAEEGLIRMTFVVTAGDTDALDDRPTIGQGVMPDGKAITGTLLRTAAWNPDAKEIQPKDTAADEDADEDADGEAGDGEAAGEEAEAQAEREGKKSDGGEAEDEKDEQASKGSEPSSYPVNFPLGAYGRGKIPEQPPVVVFQNATIWTCGQDGRLENASVIVERGLIQSVGSDLELPENAVILDCQGKHLTPGIIDCHSHIATDGGVNEGSQAITAEVRVGDFIDGEDISIYRQLAGGVTSANILHGSANPIGGQNQVIKMRWGAAPEAMKFKRAPPGIKFALGENVKRSRSSSSTRYPRTRMGVDEIINDAFRRAQHYARQEENWESKHSGMPPRVDLELEALSEVLSGDRWIHCHSYRQSEILALLNTCQRFGITIGTLQHILEGYKVANEMREHGVMGSSFADWWAYKFEVYDAIPYSGALMHDAGVVVSFNSDDAEMGRRLNLEAAKAVRFGGVPPVEALKFVTLNPARQLRIDEYVGSIEPGKDADLVVWSDNPLSVYAICEQTWIDGRKYFSIDEDRELRQRDQARHARLVQKVIESGAEQLKPGERDSSLLELWPRRDEYCRCRQILEDE